MCYKKSNINCINLYTGRDKKFKILVYISFLMLSGCFNYEKQGIFAVKTECKIYPSINFIDSDPQIVQNSGVFGYSGECKF